MSPRASLERFIRWVMRDTLYHGVYMATVQAPSTGDTVDLTTDDPRLSGLGLQGVPVSYGLPDVKATFSPGVKVMLFFENGDPSKPRAALFSGSAIQVALGGGTLPAARVGDTVSVTIPSGSSAGTYTGIIVGGAAKTVIG